MFSLFLVIIGIAAINGQSTINTPCKTPPALTGFDWEKFAATTWFQTHTTDLSYSSECISFHFQKVDETSYKIHVMGFKDNKDQSATKDIKITGKTDSKFTIGDDTYRFVIFEEKKLAVVHQCTDPKAPETFADPEKSKSKTWILSSKSVLDFGDLVKVYSRLSENDIASNIISTDFKTTIQMGDTCNGSAVTQALTGLLLACVALTRFF